MDQLDRALMERQNHDDAGFLYTHGPDHELRLEQHFVTQLRIQPLYQ